jgi:hypothetical protein
MPSESAIQASRLLFEYLCDVPPVTFDDPSEEAPVVAHNGQPGRGLALFVREGSMASWADRSAYYRKWWRTGGRDVLFDLQFGHTCMAGEVGEQVDREVAEVTRRGNVVRVVFPLIDGAQVLIPWDGAR